MTSLSDSIEMGEDERPDRFFYAAKIKDTRTPTELACLAFDPTHPCFDGQDYLREVIEVSYHAWYARRPHNRSVPKTARVSHE